MIGSIAVLPTVVVLIWAISAQNAANLATSDLTRMRAEAAQVFASSRLASAREDSAKAAILIAESQRTAAQSITELNGHRDRSLILAVEAVRLARTPESRRSLLGALFNWPLVESFYHSRRGDLGSLTFNPDGKILGLTRLGLPTSTMIFWDPERSSELHFPVTEGHIRGVAFSPDGKLCAAGTAHGVVTWDMTQPARLNDRPLNVEKTSVVSVAFSADGRILAAGCSNGEIVIFDVSRRVRVLPEPLIVDQEAEDFEIVSLAFQGDSLIVLCHGKLERWSIVDRSRKAVLSNPETELIECAELSRDGRILAAGVGAFEDSGTRVILWDTSTYARIIDQPFSIPGDHFACLALNSDGSELAAACEELVLQWNRKRNSLADRRPRIISGAKIVRLDYSPDNSRLAAGYLNELRERGDERSGAVIWNVEDRSALVDRLPSLTNEVMDVAFNPDGSTVAGAYYNTGSICGIIHWDAKRRTRLATHPFELNGASPTSIAFSPDGTSIALGLKSRSGDGEIAIWDMRLLKFTGNGTLKVAHGGVVSRVLFSPDGTSLAAIYRRTSDAGEVALWDVKQGTLLANRSLKPISHLAFSPDGKLLAAVIRDDSDNDRSRTGIELWDSRTLSPRNARRLAVDQGDIGSLTFSHDSSTIFSVIHNDSFVSNDGGIVLWDVHSGIRLENRFQDILGGDQWSPTISPDGELLATLYRGPDGEGVHLWDIVSGLRLSATPLKLADGSLTSLVFSPDGNVLAVSYSNAEPGGRGGVALLDLDIDSWVNKAARIANRNLTQEEWRRFFRGAAYHATFHH